MIAQWSRKGGSPLSIVMLQQKALLYRVVSADIFTTVFQKPCSPQWGAQRRKYMFGLNKLVRAQNDYIKALKDANENLNTTNVLQQELIEMYKSSHIDHCNIIEKQDELIKSLDQKHKRATARVSWHVNKVKALEKYIKTLQEKPKYPDERVIQLTVENCETLRELGLYKWVEESEVKYEV